MKAKYLEKGLRALRKARWGEQMGRGLAAWLEEAFRDGVQQAARLALLDLGKKKSGFLRSRPGLQPLSTGAGKNPAI